MVIRNQDVKGGSCACYHRLSLEVYVLGQLLSGVRHSCIMIRMASVGMCAITGTAVVEG